MKKFGLKCIAVILAVLMLTGMPFSASAVAENSVATENGGYGCFSKIGIIVIDIPASDYSPIYDNNGFRCGIEAEYLWVLDYQGNDLSIEIPKPTTSVALANFPKNTMFEKVFLPSSVREICSFMPSEEAGDFYCKYYECDENNESFCTVDGVLYTKDMKTLLLYPNACENKEFVLPDSVETIFDYAFSNSKYLEKITLNHNVKIGTGAFFNCNNLKIVKNHPIYPSYYWRGCFYGCNSIFAPFGLLIKAENRDLPEGWENSTQTVYIFLYEPTPVTHNDLSEGLEDSTHTEQSVFYVDELASELHSALRFSSKIINKVADKFTDRFKNRFSSSESSSVSSSEDSSSSLFVEICIAVIKIIEVFLPGLN